jgi:hypothetical protein
MKIRGGQKLDGSFHEIDRQVFARIAMCGWDTPGPLWYELIGRGIHLFETGRIECVRFAHTADRTARTDW